MQSETEGLKVGARDMQRRSAVERLTASTRFQSIVLTVRNIEQGPKGVRGVWIVTVGINALGLIPYLISGSLDWQGVAFGLVSLLLLLLPVTRRYFSDGSVDAELLGP